MKEYKNTIQLLLLLSSTLVTLVNGQCPPGIQVPCICDTTRFEPVRIVCDNARSLATVISAIGNPNVIIDSLIISNTPVLQLPDNAFISYSIKRLVFRNNAMENVSTLAFEGKIANSLEELEIRTNKLKSIPPTGISSLRQLRSLVLSKNEIENIPNFAFRNYQSRVTIRKLDLSANRIGSLLSNALVDLGAIQELNLDKNFLTVVPTAALKQLTTLEDLSVGVNSLQEIQVGSLDFPSLKSLSLEVNKLRSIPSEGFRSVPNLLYLYLSANRFRNLDPDMLRYTPKLKVLALGGNELTQLSRNSFQYVPDLVRLELAECQISAIEPETFQKIPKVQVIVLTKNKLTVIDQNMFRGLSELVSLDLKGNNISVVSDGAWSSLPQLKHLDMSSNGIQMLQPGTFAGTFELKYPPTTRVLYIYDNPWKCDQSLGWFRQWMRQNMDVMIDAPGYPPSMCNSPEWLNGQRLRSENRVTTIKPSPQSTSKPTTGSPGSDKPQPQQDEEQPNLASSWLAALILGVVLGILLLAVLLLMVVRYFVSKNRRDRKEEDEEARRLGSTLSGYQSGIGTAYPSTATHSPASTDPQRRQPGEGYFLNRPWYWWF